MLVNKKKYGGLFTYLFLLNLPINEYYKTFRTKQDMIVYILFLPVKDNKNDRKQ